MCDQTLNNTATAIKHDRLSDRTTDKSTDSTRDIATDIATDRTQDSTDHTLGLSSDCSPDESANGSFDNSHDGLSDGSYAGSHAGLPAGSPDSSSDGSSDSSPDTSEDRASQAMTQEDKIYPIEDPMVHPIRNLMPDPMPDPRTAPLADHMTDPKTDSMPEYRPEFRADYRMAHKAPRLYLFPLRHRKKSLANLFSGRLLLAAGLDWTKAESGRPLREQAKSLAGLSDMADHGAGQAHLTDLPGMPSPDLPGLPDLPDLPDHGLVIEERAGFARLYGSHTPEACIVPEQDGMQKEAGNNVHDAVTTAVNDSVHDAVKETGNAEPGNATGKAPVTDTVTDTGTASFCDAFCTVCSLAALRLQSLRHGIEVWPIPVRSLQQGSPSGSLSDSTLSSLSDSLSGSLPDSLSGSLTDSSSGTISAIISAPISGSKDSRPGTIYWVFAARLGRLSARADKCFTSLDEALSLARRLQDSLDLQEPRVLDETEVREEFEKLSESGSQVISKAKLNPLSLLSCQILHNKSLRKGLAAILFGGLLLSACYFFSDPITNRLFPAGQTNTQMQGQHARQEAASVLLHPERYFPSAWLTAPSPAASVLAIVPEMLKTPLTANGWTLEEVSSDKNTLTATWKAARATSLLLPPYGARRLAQDATRAKSVTDTPLPDAKERQWQDLDSKDEIQAVLSELAARFGLKMQLSWKPVRIIKKENAVISCPWVTGSLVLSQAPGTLFFDFPNLTECLKEQRLEKSLVLSGITWNKKQWIMQGEVYAKP